MGGPQPFRITAEAVEILSTLDTATTDNASSIAWTDVSIFYDHPVKEMVNRRDWSDNVLVLCFPRDNLLGQDDWLGFTHTCAIMV